MTTHLSTDVERRQPDDRAVLGGSTGGSGEGLPHIHALSGGGQAAGWVVIDSLVRSRAHGGLRMSPTVDEVELGTLARTMTLKYGYLRQPFGGAKAGIRCDPEESTPHRRQSLAQFAQAARPLLRSRTYVPAPDMGTDADDIRLVMEQAGLRVSPRQLKVSRSGTYTAITTLQSAIHATRIVGGKFDGADAAVEGFGKVGAALASLLTDAGVRVVAVSTSRGAVYDAAGLDLARLTQLEGEFGSRAVEHYPRAREIPAEALPTLPVDLLFPCAGYHTIDGSSQQDIRAPIICPGANNPLTEAAEIALFERGVLVVPDFVANCGGVLGSVLEFASIGVAEIERTLVAHTDAHVGRLLARARREGVPPRRVAEALARRRFEEMSRSRRSPLAGPFEFGLALYRAGIVPAGLFSALARPALRRRLSWQDTDDT